jgi:DNA helicase HerA-like ATPase
MSTPLLIARTLDNELFLLPAMANRHGLITGATGTGKTVTLQKLAESLSDIGVPVFMADVKGDLTGVAQEGTASEKLIERLKNIGITDWEPHKNPVVVWDIFGEKGHPVRATVSDLGPLLLARLLNLNDVQSGVLNIIFRIADDQGLLLLDFKDLRAITQYIGDNAKSFQNQYGNISSASVGAIQRGLLTLEQQGAEHFFGEPMLDIKDWMRTDSNGKGIINILSSEKLYQMPKLYAASLLWMLSELYEQLPEAGDLDKPKLVFFFDEAHLLFNDAPQVLLDKIEQVIRLIRSKGVGVWFVSQNPSDIPDNVLGQLGNRVQHALRAFTPKDQKAVKAAAQTMRANPAFDTEAAIQALGTGEALISFLDAKGSPSVVERAMVIAPCSRMGPVTDDERNGLINNSPVYGKYEDEVDRESAFEMLQKGYRRPRNRRMPPQPPAASLLPWMTVFWVG